VTGPKLMTLDEIRSRTFATVAEVAELLDGTDERTVRRAISDGQIPAIKVGTKTLIPVPRLLALIEPAAGQPEQLRAAAEPTSDAVAAAREILRGALRALEALSGDQARYQDIADQYITADQGDASGGLGVPPRLLKADHGAA
jgi:excisionase family DNA binding protein